MKPHYLAIQHNSDGRPCGWGRSTNKQAAIEEAKNQYRNHECYATEELGRMTITEIAKDGTRKSEYAV